MSLLNKYQKDKTFLKKDIDKLKQESAFVLQEMSKDPVEEMKKNKEKPVNKPRTIDPSLTMNERHKAVQEMREKRLAERDSRVTTGNYAQRTTEPMSMMSSASKSKSRQTRHNNSRQRTQSGAQQAAAHSRQIYSTNDDLDAIMDRAALPQQRKPKQQTKQPMQGATTTQADFQLKKVRQQREDIDQQTKEYQDEYKKVQLEI